jgi:hypothetical protein
MTTEPTKGSFFKSYSTTTTQASTITIYPEGETDMADKLIATAAAKKFFARKMEDVRLFSPPQGSANNPRLLVASSEPFECNTPIAAPLSGTSYDPGTFSIEDNIITIIKPGVYLITASVFFATYDQSADPPFDSLPSQWGHLQQAGVTLGTKPGASPSYTPVAVGTPHYGVQAPTEDLLRFTNIFTTFQNNMTFVLRATATYSHSKDHPVVLRADVRMLKIAPLQIYG